jgi:hypothetical protein
MNVLFCLRFNPQLFNCKGTTKKRFLQDFFNKNLKKVHFFLIRNVFAKLNYTLDA